LVYLKLKLRHNSLSKCVLQPEIKKKFAKTHYFWVQGRSRPLMLVPPDRSSAVLAMMRSKSVSICNRSHARRANSGKIMMSLMPLFEGNLPNQQHEIRSPETRDSTLSLSKNPESLSHLGLNWYRVMTDRRTDRITIANTGLLFKMYAIQQYCYRY